MNKNTTSAPRPRGRPRAEQPRNTGLLLKFNDTEMAVIEQKARQAEKPKAVWIRETVLAA